MEFIFEILFEVYIELMLFIVPEEKAASQKYRVLAIVFAVLALLGVFALFIWGCVLISDYHNMLGLIPITVAIVLSLIQIVAGLVLHDRRSK